MKLTAGNGLHSSHDGGRKKRRRVANKSLRDVKQDDNSFRRDAESDSDAGEVPKVVTATR